MRISKIESMVSNNQGELEERMRALDNHALLHLVAVEAADYRPEAVEIACKELERRRWGVLTREQYWSQFPAERVGGDGFCSNCRTQTTDESPGGTSVVNFIFGTRLIGHDDRCPSCGSVRQTMWFQFILPIIPLGTYRIIYLERGLMSGRYVGRKVRK